MVHFVFLAIASSFSSDSCKFRQQSDEFKLASHTRPPQMNELLFNAILSKYNNNYAFDTDSIPKIIDCGASSSATTNKSDFIEGTCKPLQGITISGIASELKAPGIG